MTVRMKWTYMFKRKNVLAISYIANFSELNEETLMYLKKN